MASDLSSRCSHGAGSTVGSKISPSCRPDFHSTLVFEQSFLSLGLSISLLVLASMRLYTLYGCSVKTSPNYMRIFKLIATTLFAAIQLALLILWSTGKDYSIYTSLPSATFRFIGALAIFLLSYIEHSRSIRPSTLLNVCLFISLTFDIFQARTIFLLDETHIVAPVFAAGVGTELVLLILEGQAKTTYLKPEYRNLSPEATSGVFNRLLFWWINSLLIVGYKRLFLYKDLPTLDDELSSARLRSKMQMAWHKRVKPESPWALLFAVARCLQWPLLSAAVPRICLIVLKYAQPFLISFAISYVSETDIQVWSDIASYGLIPAVIFISTGIAISTASYRRYINRIITMFRGAMVGLIYDKSLSLQDGLYDNSAAIALMSTDVDIICDAIPTVYEAWAQLIEVVVGFWLLGRQLGWVCLVPLVIVILCSSTSTQTGKKISGKQRAWTGAVQRRIAMTSSMLGSIKSLKMMGLSQAIQVWIQDQRIRELDLAKKFRWMVILLNTIGNVVPVFAPAATFIVYAIQAKLRGLDPLSTNLVFTSLALLSMVTGPSTRLLFIVPSLASSGACFQRLQKFLLDPSRRDQRHGGDHSSRMLNRTTITSPELRSPRPPLIDLTAAILFDHVTVRPSPTAEPVLVNIDMRLETSSITIVAGPVGSGKSTLIKAILGELPFEGQISVSSKQMGYCDQIPWLLNESIRKNLCGFADEFAIDELWYQNVVHACALEEDMAQLPDGDQTVIGSRGISLSGGQRQRLALARAVYSKMDIVLLDDVLSALDAKTEHKVVERLLGPTGLLRRLGTTVVLATHAIQHFHLADHIMVLGNDGKIAQRGTYDSLISQKVHIGSTLLKSDPLSNYSSTTVEQTVKSKAIKSPSNDDAMDLTRKTGDIAVYSYWFKSINMLGVVAFFGSAGAYSFFLAFSQYWLKWWTEDDSGNTIKYSSVYVLLSLGASSFEAIMISWVLIMIGPGSAAKLHHTLLKTVLRAPLSYFSEIDAGVTLNRFSQDMSLIDRVLPVSAMNVVIQAFKILAQGILLFSAEKFMTGTIPFYLVVVFIIQRIYLRTSRQIRFMDLESRSPVYSQFLETLEGLSTIRAFGWQEHSVNISIKRLDRSQQTYYLMFCIQCWLGLVLDLLVAALAIFIISLAVFFRSTISGGQIGIALNVVLVVNTILLRLIETWTQMETSLGAIARLKTLQTNTFAEDKPGENCIPPRVWPENGFIEFRNVTATYGSDIAALRNISMTISPGQKIGICGRTGSGKSSLLLTLLRLVDMVSGTIVVDGHDLQTIPREVIRNRLIAIPQDPFILNDTVRRNIDPSQSIPDSRITEALTKVHLWATISSRGGLDEQMKPLSQGQLQLFCLARAMLRKSKILILDEATSNLDAETNKWTREIIKEEFKDHTVITIAHQMESIVESDLVAVLDKGVLVEFGPPADLLGRQSFFTELNNK